MTIKPLDHLNQTPTQAKPQAAARQAEGPDFASLLAGQKTAPAPKTQAWSAEAILLQNQALSGLMMPGLETASLKTRQQLERTLDQMDRYAVALGDEDRTLKDIAPLADDLGQEADRLSRLSLKLKESDPLKGLSNEAAVLATVEAMKFKRGDYV
ncbi:MAG: hypothetical protein LBV70_04895 [Candidatus Adiutrix sp.]|jgi:hypothetical protein|nr:hypothetical protein [Candidatus Adiutrix sp.]